MSAIEVLVLGACGGIQDGDWGVLLWMRLTNSTVSRGEVDVGGSGSKFEWLLRLGGFGRSLLRRAESRSKAGTEERWTGDKRRDRQWQGES